jgi:hypothetical protein
MIINFKANQSSKSFIENKKVTKILTEILTSKRGKICQNLYPNLQDIINKNSNLYPVRSAELWGIIRLNQNVMLS